MDDKMVRRVMKLRSQGWTWSDVRNETKLTRSQCATVRKRMRELDPKSVGPGPGAKAKPRRKTAAKRK